MRWLKRTAAVGVSNCGKCQKKNKKNCQDPNRNIHCINLINPVPQCDHSYLRYNHILMWGQNTVSMGISDLDFKLNWVNNEILLRMSTLWGLVWKHHTSLENPFERLFKDNSINASIGHSLIVNKSNNKSWVAQQITHCLQSSWDHTYRILPAIYVCLLKQGYICSYYDCVLNQHAVTAKCVPALKWRNVCWHA